MVLPQTDNSIPLPPNRMGTFFRYRMSLTLIAPFSICSVNKRLDTRSTHFIEYYSDCHRYNILGRSSSAESFFGTFFAQSYIRTFTSGLYDKISRVHRKTLHSYYRRIRQNFIPISINSFMAFSTTFPISCYFQANGICRRRLFTRGSYNGHLHRNGSCHTDLLWV